MIGFKTGVQKPCKECGKLFTSKGQNSVYCTTNCRKLSDKGMWKTWGKTYRTKHPEKYILKTLKERSKKKGYDFNLEESDLLIPKACPILGLELILSSDLRGDPASVSVDRIDNSKGYVKGNIQIISLLANQMKSSANVEQLHKFANWVKLNV